jgi:Ca2+-binding EF-hand superfamily protein
MAYNTAKN